MGLLKTGITMFFLCCFLNTITYVPGNYRMVLPEELENLAPEPSGTLMEYLLDNIMELPAGEEEDDSSLSVYFKRFSSRNSEDFHLINAVIAVVLFFMMPVAALQYKALRGCRSFDFPLLPGYYNFLFRLSPF